MDCGQPQTRWNGNVNGCREAEHELAREKRALPSRPTDLPYILGKPSEPAMQIHLLGLNFQDQSVGIVPHKMSGSCLLRNRRKASTVPFVPEAESVKAT